jgi:hypothetical protein
MFDFILATGISGIAGVVVIFFVVFLLAEPEEEISFWGIKFRKRRIAFPLYKFRRYPESPPEDWFVVYEIFRSQDRSYLTIASFYHTARNVSKELKIRVAVDQMKKFGLIRESINYIALTEAGLIRMSNINETQ